MYYLQSRYYNPTVGRFINADAYAATGQGLLGNNMFAYCGNDPVNRADSAGNFFFTVLGAFIGAATGYFDALMTGTDPLLGAEAGFVSGAISGAGVDIGVLLTAGTVGAWWVVAGLAAAGTLGAIGSAVGTGIASDWTADFSDYMGAAIVGGGMNMLSFGLAPINGEIAKASLDTMIDILVIEGERNLVENTIMGTLVAEASIWIIRAGSGKRSTSGVTHETK